MNVKYIIFSFFMVILLSSCAGLSKQDIDNMKTPPPPYNRFSEYSQALDKFSAMLAAYDLPEEGLFLLGKTVTNKTACANLPLDITQMVATAVNKIGGTVRYIPYNPTYLELEYRVGQPAGRAMPMLVIDGAITECDENLDGSELNVDANAVISHQGQEGEASGGYGRTSNVSRIALDFHLMDYQTSILLPRIQSSIAVDVRTLKGGYDFAIQVLGSGFGLNRSRKITQGKHEAIRSLVDVSILQILGQYLQVPYWRCLPGATPDKLVVRALEETFAAAPEEIGIATLQILLQKHGYSSVQETGVQDSATRQAIVDVSAKSNNVVPAMVGPALYSYLYINMPFNSTKPASIVASSSGQEITPDASSNIAEPEDAPNQELGHTLLNLQTAVIYRAGKIGETVLISGGKLRSGEHYKVVVQPEQDCYLYVFQLDSGGRLFPLFPGSDLTSRVTNPVKGNVVYKFPGDQSYFFLDKRLGDEQIIFYSTAEPDLLVERNLRLLTTQLTDEALGVVEKELLAHFATKEVVLEADPGEGIALKGANGPLHIKMDRVQKLSRNKVYIFAFQHQE